MKKWEVRHFGSVAKLFNGRTANLAETGSYKVYGSNGVIGFSNEFKHADILIIGRVGAYCGSVFYERERCWATDNAIVAKINQDHDSIFIYHLIRRMPLRELAGGSAQPLINQTILERLRFTSPSLPIQRKIAAVLSAYDDLIENNNRRIALLEKMAEELYREWFVRLRFPGHETTKIVKGVPEGWEVMRIGDLVSRLKFGRIFRADELSYDGETPVIDQSTNDTLGYYSGTPEHIATESDPIITFGDHSCKLQIHFNPFSLAENVIPFHANNRTNTLFLHESLKGIIETREYKRHWTDLTKKEIYLPSISAQNEFARPALAHHLMIKRLRHHNRKLTATRDRLLTRLMSGKIDLAPLDIAFPPSMQEAA